MYVGTFKIDIIIFIGNIIISLTSHILIIFKKSIKISSFILTLSLGEVKRKMSILPITNESTVYIFYWYNNILMYIQYLY